MRHLLTLLPVGFSAEAAEASGVTATATELVCSGGIWDYHDTAVLVEALERMRAAGRPTRLRFLYAPAGKVLVCLGRDGATRPTSISGRL
ncbi:hypothetical protein [Micromonospora sp. NBC_01412]|uniref:hypothetical protein n=1 Tax=Micromonospora sp. NBC_01412 TaxID=2903590 RepID=UPI0032468D6D